jgi:hypothetical protein
MLHTPLLPLLSLIILAVLEAVVASPCVVFDANFNLLAFGLNGKDYNAGTQDSWTDTKSAADITTSGRPPFNGSNTVCYLAQFLNTIYVFGGDSANPSAVHIYDAAAKSWSTQAVNTPKFDLASFNAVLDHDTNVFYALSGGELFFLDMRMLKAADTSALSWTDVQRAPFAASYQPIMALAQNHIHFLNTPGQPAGTAQIFVIHFSVFQPVPQMYPATSGNTFPNTHGRTASFFRTDSVQEEFAFVPDDGSMTYVINVQTNSTRSLPGPPGKNDPGAQYAAGVTSLVQLDSKGIVSFIPFTPNAAQASAPSAWSSVQPIALIPPPQGVDSTSRGTSTQTAVTTNVAATGMPASPTGSTSGAVSQRNCAAMSVLVAVMLVIV